MPENLALAIFDLDNQVMDEHVHLLREFLQIAMEPRPAAYAPLACPREIELEAACV